LFRKKKIPWHSVYKITQNDDGFFAEAHVKLRPNDFATDGVFVCGLAHAPKPIDESISQAQAAASRAVTVLSSLELSVSGMVALIDPNFCSRCGVCVSVCPYSAPKFNEKPPRPKFSRPCARAADFARPHADPAPFISRDLIPVKLWL
jgi:heterodisulfide reductase subunit A